MRIWASLGAALLLTVEALVTALLGTVLGYAVRAQHMSMGGLSTQSMAVGAWAGLGALAVFLLLVAAVLAFTALRRRAMGRPTRILLIVCAVLHGVLAAVSLALSGWLPFVVLISTLGAVVLVIQSSQEPGSSQESGQGRMPGPRTPPLPDGAPKPAS